MKKKILSMSLTAALLVSMLAGCGDAANGNTSGSDDSGEAREITMMIEQSHNKQGLQDMITKMEAEKNIVVDAQVTPDDQYQEMMIMKFSTGEGTDMVDFNIPHLYGQLKPTDYFADLSDSTWVPKLINPEISTYEDGKVYAYTFYANDGYQGMIYNKQVFADNGIEIPTTVEEFNAACETLKAAGITPVLVAGGSQWMPQVWTSAAYGRAMGTKEAATEMSNAVFAGEKKFTDYPQLAAAFDELLTMRDNGYLNEDISTLTVDDARVKLTSGEGAMLIGYTSIVNEEALVNPDIDLGMFNPPVSVDDKNLLSATLFSFGFSVNKDSENVELCKEIFELWSTEPYTDAFFAETPGFSALEGTNGGVQDADVQALWDEHVAADTIVPEMNLSWTIIESLQADYLWTYYDEALTKGDMTGAEVLDKYNEDVMKYLKAEGYGE